MQVTSQTRLLYVEIFNFAPLVGLVVMVHYKNWYIRPTKGNKNVKYFMCSEITVFDAFSWFSAKKPDTCLYIMSAASYKFSAIVV
jgi:hypothetical protein